jgi:hypothetical protein
MSDLSDVVSVLSRIADSIERIRETVEDIRDELDFSKPLSFAKLATEKLDQISSDLTALSALDRIESTLCMIESNTDR